MIKVTLWCEALVGAPLEWASLFINADDTKLTNISKFENHRLVGQHWCADRLMGQPKQDKHRGWGQTRLYDN